MAWIELHQSLPQHRKLLALRDALGLRTPAALGHMCLLWLWALDNAPDGDLSALPARQLAEICQFSERRAGDLAVALRTSGFVDADWRLHGRPAASGSGGGAHGCARRPWKKTRRMVHEKADEHRPAAKAARAARGV